MLICEVCYKKKIEKGGGKMVDTVVKVSNLTKSYGKNKVLSGVNITLERGKNIWFYRTKWCWKDNHDQSYQWTPVSR